MPKSKVAILEVHPVMDENNEAEGLLRMVAVLLRENGEEYNEFVFEKNMVDFLQLPLQVAYEVSFF